jgi:WD40 repeat protein
MFLLEGRFMSTRMFSSPRTLGVLAGVLVLAPMAWADAKDEWTAPAVLEDQKGTGWFLAFSPDGKMLAATSGGYDQQARKKLPNSVRLWDVETRKLIRTLVADGPIIQGLAFTSDGKQLVTAGYDGTFRRVDVASGKEVDMVKIGERMNTVRFSPDRKLVLLVNPKAKQGQLLIQNEYQLREVDTGKTVTPEKPFPTEPVLAVGPDAQSLVITVMQPPDPRVKLPPGVSPIGGPMEGHLWDAKTGEKSEALLQGTMTDAVFSPDGKLVLLNPLALTSSAKAIQFWNVADKKLSPEKIPLTHNFNRIAFADDGSLLAAGSDDRAVRLFETTKMKEVAVLKGTAPAEAVLFAPDGKMLAAAQADGTIRLWTRKGP